MKKQIQLLASYNRYMNNAVYGAAAKLSTEDFTADKRAFFGSVQGTLNHILVADTVWLKRYTRLRNFESLAFLNNLADPTGLDQILFAELPALTEQRETMDEHIIRFADELTESDLVQPLSYLNTKGKPFTKEFGALLLHFFNHQTHHRGQVTTLLTQMNVDVGVTDLLAIIPNTL